jgi:hypothetical protein
MVGLLKPAAIAVSAWFHNSCGVSLLPGSNPSCSEPSSAGVLKERSIARRMIVPDRKSKSRMEKGDEK